MRGNRYSRPHLKYNPNHNEAFWHFSWDDMARDDLPSSNILRWLGKYACNEFFIDRLICKNMLFIIDGPDTKNLNTSPIPVYTTHGPSRTSVKNMVHFIQCGRSNQFQADNTAIFWADED